MCKCLQTASSTATLIVISVVFLVLNIPGDPYYYNNGLPTSNTPVGYAASLLFYSCINLLLYTNHSINFLMYFVSGRKFRLAAKDTLTCHWCRGRWGSLGKSSTATGKSSSGET